MIYKCFFCCKYLRHTAAEQIAYIITRIRSIQVELRKVEGFAQQNAVVNANQPFKCKAAISLAAYAT